MRENDSSIFISLVFTPLFWKIARGKYYKPKSENRIFMFVDLNSSTTLAEKLGNERYHELLKDFFADILQRPTGIKTTKQSPY